MAEIHWPRLQDATPWGVPEYTSARVLGDTELLPDVPAHLRGARHASALRFMPATHLVDAVNIMSVAVVSLEQAADSIGNVTLEREVDDWFECVREWVEIVTRQSAAARSHLKTHNATAGGRTREVGVVNGRGEILPGNLEVDCYAGSLHEMWGRPATSEELTQASERVNRNTAPPPAYLLHRSARAALVLADYRQCAIYGATALEVAIKEWVTQRLNSSKDPEVSRAVRRDLRGLGSWLELAKILGAPLRPDLHGLAVKPRNAAAHEGDRLDETTAWRAWEATAEALDALDPIHAHLRSRSGEVTDR